jgi:hypothetical protein
MQALILNMFKQSDATLNQDQSRVLFIISHFQAFKLEAHLDIINIVSTLYVL